jgi:HK97 gp10 family phage protein
VPSVSVEVDTGAIHALLSGPTGIATVVTAGKQVVNAAKRLCPVDTGRLRSSITDELGVGPTGLPAVRIGSNVSYASYVELGTRYMSAQPFLRPALGSISGTFTIGGEA